MLSALKNNRMRLAVLKRTASLLWYYEVLQQQDTCICNGFVMILVRGKHLQANMSTLKNWLGSAKIAPKHNDINFTKFSQKMKKSIFFQNFFDGDYILLNWSIEWKRHFETPYCYLSAPNALIYPLFYYNNPWPFLWKHQYS